MIELYIFGPLIVYGLYKAYQELADAMGGPGTAFRIKLRGRQYKVSEQGDCIPKNRGNRIVRTVCRMVVIGVFGGMAMYIAHNLSGGNLIITALIGAISSGGMSGVLDK